MGEDTQNNHPRPSVMRLLARALLSHFGSWLVLGPLPDDGDNGDNDNDDDNDDDNEDSYIFNKI